MTGLWSRLRSEWQRMRGLRERTARDARMNEEMRFHLDMLVARNARSGMTGEEARRAALVEFGGIERFTERSRDEYRSRPLEDLGRDARHAVRNLVRMPAFSIAAVLTLALGIGATTVMYSIVDHVVLRPLPYRDADRLVLVREVVQEIRDAYPTISAHGGHYLQWRERCTLCDDVAALRAGGMTWSGGGDPVLLDAMRVSPNLFPLLGVRPLHGRLFHEDEDRIGMYSVVILSHDFWVREFNADAAVVGSSIMVDGAPRTIVGVLPADARLPKREELGKHTALPDNPQIFNPLPLALLDQPGGGFDFVAIAKLKPGVTLTQAQTHFDELQRRIEDPRNLTLSAAVSPLQDHVVGAARRNLIMLLGAVGCVLLLVCVNLASLLAARNASRAREAAVRVALGAGRMRLVRESLTESVVLGLFAGVVGLLLAHYGLRALLQLAPPDLPRLHEVRFDTRVAAAGVLLSLLTGLLFGGIPALRTGGADPNEALKAGGRTQTEGRRTTRARTSLIAAQIAVTAVLLVVAGLFLTSFARVLQVDRGFSAEQALALDVVVPGTAFNDPSEVEGIYARVLEQLRAVPGVADAAATSRLPLDGVLWADAISQEHDARPGDQQPVGNFHFVTPEYFATLDVPIQRGSAFSATQRGRNVVVLSAHVAALVFPDGRDPIGQRVALGGRIVADVVGVAADVAATGIEAEPSPIVYIPPWTTEFAFPQRASIVIRTTVDPASIAPAARAALRNAGAGLALARTRTIQQMVDEATASRRFQVSLLLLFAFTALLTACVGIYGVVAHSLAGRRGEIGVRMALGARRVDIHRAVLREGVGATLLGLLAGMVAALVLGLFIQSLLFGVRATNPLVFVSVAALLTVVAAVACYVPARRASGRAVVAALRQE
jgi:predicted permease